ncbi:MAG: von Willebrand factor type A domain-containing protein [Opitutales bacterium]
MAHDLSHPSSDPRLTAYLLDELEAAERTAFEAELQRDADLREALAELRKVSSALSGLYRVEGLPPGASAGPARPAMTAAALRARRRLESSDEREARIALLKKDAPRIGSSRRSRFSALGAALAAAVALAGLYVFDAFTQVATGRLEDDMAAVVPVRSSGPDEFERAVPLADTIAATLEAEAAQEAAEREAVSAAVAEGLALALESDGENEGGQERARAPLPSLDLAGFGRLDAPVPAAARPPEATRAARSPAERPRRSLEVTSATTPELAAATFESAASGDESAALEASFRRSEPAAAPVVTAEPETDASYQTVRAELYADRLPAPSAVRIDSLVNYFSYAGSGASSSDAPFEVEMEVAEAPWDPVHQLIRLTLHRRPGEAPVEALEVAVEFNLAQVAAYRLLGYDDSEESDAGLLGGEVGSWRGSGSVTALYEVVPVGAPSTALLESPEAFRTAPVRPSRHAGADRSLMWVEVSYAPSAGAETVATEFRLEAPEDTVSWRQASRAFRWAAAVASFGLELRGELPGEEASWELVEALARSAVGDEAEREEFLSLIDRARRLRR